MKIITSRSNWALQKDDLRAKNYIFTKHKVAIRFPVKNDNYHTAFKCISKSDENVYTRQIHPNLKEVSSPPRLSSLYLSELITENNTKSENELFAIVDEQKKASKNVLTNSFYLAQRRHWVTLKYLEGDFRQQKILSLKTSLYGN